MFSGDIPFLGRIEAKVKQQWRIMLFSVGLAVACLGEEMRLPFTDSAGREFVTAIVEERRFGQRLAVQQQRRKIPSVDPHLLRRRRAAECESGWEDPSR